MPRKTTQTLEHGFPVTPYHLGPKLIDDEGDSVTDPTANAVRVIPVSGAGVDISENIIRLGDVKDVLDEHTEELKRIRRANEFILGQEVELIEE